MTNLKELLEKEVQDLFSSETQLQREYSTLTMATSHDVLRGIMEEHSKQTKIKAERLRMAASLLECNPEGLKKCKGMKRLLKEAKELIALPIGNHVKDAALIGTMQRIIHYKMAGYGNAYQYAETLGLDEVARVLIQSLDEEKKADKVLSEIAIKEINELAKK